MIKIIGITICILIATLLIRNYNKSFAVLLSLSGITILFFLVLDKTSNIIRTLLSLSENLSYAYEYVKLMIKILGIMIVSQLMSQICIENGELSLSSMVLLSAKIIIITLVLPLFELLIEIVLGIIK